jgi:hypothetical protein
VQSVLASLKFRSILSSLHTFRQGGASILAPLGSRCELFLFRCFFKFWLKRVFLFDDL